MQSNAHGQHIGPNGRLKHELSEDELTGTLESLDVLWALGELSNGLDKGHTGLLVSLEWGKHCTRHSFERFSKVF